LVSIDTSESNTFFLQIIDVPEQWNDGYGNGLVEDARKLSLILKSDILNDNQDEFYSFRFINGCHSRLK